MSNYPELLPPSRRLYNSERGFSRLEKNLHVQKKIFIHQPPNLAIPAVTEKVPMLRQKDPMLKERNVAFHGDFIIFFFFTFRK